ncbi:unnamed protein product, partial [marine sediment metagenome]
MELVKRETCLEYFHRRLSEGWKCISLEGYNAVLLSPDGVRRTLDLRHDILTLRPNSDTSQGISQESPTQGTHYDLVDDAGTGDGDTTHVRQYGVPTCNTWGYDRYGLPNHTDEIGAIDKVTIFCRMRYVD